MMVDCHRVLIHGIVWIRFWIICCHHRAAGIAILPTVSICTERLATLLPWMSWKVKVNRDSRLRITNMQKWLVKRRTNALLYVISYVDHNSFMLMDWSIQQDAGMRCCFWLTKWEKSISQSIRLVTMKNNNTEFSSQQCMIMSAAWSWQWIILLLTGVLL